MKCSNRSNSLIASFLIFGYLFTSLTLSGIPGWSRIAPVCGVLLFSYVAICTVQFRWTVETWMAGPIIFLILCGLLTFLAEESVVDIFFTTVVSWAGAVAIAQLVRYKVGAINIVLHSLVLASACNAGAVLLGFDSYIVYTADLSELSEDVLKTRASGLVGNANLLAVQALLPIFALLIWKNSATKILWALAILAGGVALVATGSRKGIILMLAIFVPVLFKKNSIGIAFRLIFVFTFGLISLLLVSGIPDIEVSWVRNLAAIDRIFNAMEGRDDSFSERYGFLEIGVRLFLDSPIIGYGLDMFRHVSKTGFYSHNNFIEILVSGGVLLFLSYYSMYVFAFARVIKDFKGDTGALAVRLILLSILLILEVSMVTFNVRIFPVFICLLATKVAIHPVRY